MHVVIKLLICDINLNFHEMENIRPIGTANWSVGNVSIEDNAYNMLHSEAIGPFL